MMWFDDDDDSSMDGSMDDSSEMGDPFAAFRNSGGGSRKRKRGPAEEKTGLAALSVAELKNKCRELGLKVSGNKADLIARIEAHEGGLPEPVASTSVKTKKGKTAALDISNKIREGLQYFFGNEVILPKPKYHDTGASDPEDQVAMYDTSKHGEPFLEGSEVEDLRAALNNEELFTVKGTMEEDPKIIFKVGQQTSALPFIITEKDEPTLQSITTDAPFGRGSETVIDKSVRSCRQLSPDGFTINNQEWNKMFSTSQQSTLLEEIRQILSPNNSEITAELYKFLYYPKESFFKPHVDTQRDPNMFATLVVQLPVGGWCYGGDLRVTHKGVTKNFKPERGCVTWIAFYSSCEHSVERVSSGFRCTLIYNLKRTGQEIPAQNLSQDAKICQKIDRVFATKDEKKDFILGHLMDYQYAISNVVPAVLKGLDAQIFQAAKQSGKYDLMLVPIQVERTGCGGCGEERNKNLAEEFINSDENPQFGTWVVDPAEPVQGGKNSQSYAAIHKDALEAMAVKWIEKQSQIQKAKTIAKDIAPTGNEGVGALMIYIHACLLIRKKKGDEAKVFPSGLSIASAPAANTNNNNE